MLSHFTFFHIFTRIKYVSWCQRFLLLLLLLQLVCCSRKKICTAMMVMIMRLLLAWQKYITPLNSILQKSFFIFSEKDTHRYNFFPQYFSVKPWTKEQGSVAEWVCTYDETYATPWEKKKWRKHFLTLLFSHSRSTHLPIILSKQAFSTFFFMAIFFEK